MHLFSPQGNIITCKGLRCGVSKRSCTTKARLRCRENAPAQINSLPPLSGCACARWLCRLWRPGLLFPGPGGAGGGVAWAFPRRLPPLAAVRGGGPFPALAQGPFGVGPGAAAAQDWAGPARVCSAPKGPGPAFVGASGLWGAGVCRGGGVLACRVVKDSCSFFRFWVRWCAEFQSLRARARKCVCVC